MKILIVQTSFLGDTILSTPVIEGVKAIYPEAELWMMTTPLSYHLVERDPLLDGVIPFDKRGKESGFKGLFAMAERLRSMNFDLVYSLHRSYRTAVLLWLARIPVRIGFTVSRLSFLYHQTFSRDSGAHDVIRNLSILKGWDEPETFPGEMRLFGPDISQVREPIQSSIPRGPYAVLFPGSVGRTKQWDPEGFKKTANYLLDKGISVILMGAPSEAVVNERVAEGLALSNLTGKTTLPEAVAIMGGASLVVCNDSMSLHMASALKIPTVAIFCATAPSLGFGPWRNRARVVEADLACRPCSQRGRRSCPNGTDACMTEVPFEKVAAAVDEMLTPA